MPAQILVVDDEPDLRHIINLVFKKQIRSGEYQFHFALNGLEALETLRAHEEIGLVMTDLNMPEMDGLTLLKQIKKLNMTLKAVVVSAYGDLSNIRAAMNHGAFDFLTKPINLKDLEITVKKTLKEHDLLMRALQSRDQLISIRKELDIAQQLQMSMMPPLPRVIGNYRVGGQILLSDKVGGDFWDLIELSEHEALIVLGDCSGHGLSSALIMSAIRHSLKTLVTHVDSYRDFAKALNQLVYQEFSARHRYATMIFVHIDTRGSSMRLLRAGHELPLLRRNGCFEPQDWSGGLPIGIFPKRGEDEWVSWSLEPGDELYLYTDGVVDGLSEPLKAGQLLGDMGDVGGLLEEQSFFARLKERYDWQRMDDATVLSIRREA